MYKENSIKICASIEARMTSSRLPGKVLMELGGKPALEQIIERLSRSKYLDEIVVATTENSTDNPIVDLCNLINCKYYRGSEEDVLSRVLNAVKSVNADLIVEITGDCPVVDHRHVDHLIQLFFSGKYDYVSNALKRTFPDGFDVQVFPVSILEEVDRFTKSPVDREHVSLYIYTHPEKYRLLNWSADKEMKHPELEVTLDTEEDYKLLKEIYDELYYKDNDFSAKDVVELLLKRKDLGDIVKDIRRKNALNEKKVWEEENEY